MSYLDRKNILSEGFFGALKKYFKDRKNMSKAEKKLFKDPGVIKAYSKFKKSEKDFYSDIERLKKKYNVKD